MVMSSEAKTTLAKSFSLVEEAISAPVEAFTVMVSPADPSMFAETRP